jgi:hypothetical protein
MTSHDIRDERHAGRGMITLPLAPRLALCLCCVWAATGSDASAQAAAHRDETSHVTIASRADG